jgi:anti-sigma B factor antagonist
MEDLGDGTVLHFRGRKVRLDENSTLALGEQLDRVIEERGRCRLILDFGNVDYLTSSTLALLVSFNRRLYALGGSLTLRDLAPHLHEIFVVTQLDKLFDIREGDGVASLRRNPARN